MTGSDGILSSHAPGTKRAPTLCHFDVSAALPTALDFEFFPRLHTVYCILAASALARQDCFRLCFLVIH